MTDKHHVARSWPNRLQNQPGDVRPHLLSSFLLVLSFYGESLGGRGFVTVLPTIALQTPLDRARGELPSDTRTLISHWEKFRGKTGEIWRSVIATYKLLD